MEPELVTLLNPSRFALTPEPPEFLTFVGETDVELGAVDAELGDQVWDLWNVAVENPAEQLTDTLEEVREELDVRVGEGPDLADAVAAADEVDALQIRAYNSIPPEAWQELPAHLEAPTGEFQAEGEAPPPPAKEEEVMP